VRVKTDISLTSLGTTSFSYESKGCSVQSTSGFTRFSRTTDDPQEGVRPKPR